MKRVSDNIVKVLSLGIGLAVGIVLIAKVFFELSYDSFYRDVDRVYLIMTNSSRNGDVSDYSQVSGGIAGGFMAEVPGVEVGTRTTPIFDGNIYMDEEGNRLRASLVVADTCFFRVFDRPILAGDPQKALGEWGCVMVSRSFAVKMFGGVEEAMDRQIANEDLADVKLTVRGVFEDFPDNGSLHHDILLSMVTYNRNSTENWIGNDRYTGYVKLFPGVDPGSLTDAIRKMQEAHQPLEELERGGTTLRYWLRPFDKIHTSHPQVRSQVILLSVVTVLLILISLLNYILIVISSLVRRSREVGVRKCYGAEGRHIYGMLSREALLHVALSLALAAALILAGRGLIKNLLGMPFGTLLVPQSVTAVAALILFVLAVSIVVPAELYQRIPVHAALQDYREHSRRWKLALLGTQIFINVFLVVMLLVIGRQYRLVLRSDPGYDYENLYFVNIYGGNADQRRVISALELLPEVSGVEACNSLPIFGCSGDNIYLPGEYRELFNIADQYEATPGFFALLDIPFVDGRAPRDSTEAAVDEKFVARMAEFADWSDGAVGKQFLITGHNRTQYTVSGVYRSYLIGNALQVDDRPSALFYGEAGSADAWMPHILFKLQDPDEATFQKLRAVVSEALDGRELNILSFAGSLRAAYDDSKKMRNTLALGSVFSLLVALLGLIAFLRDENLRRSKEIAVRKINGATTRDILALCVRDILKLALAAAVPACAVAAFAARGWLEQFAERTALSPAFFAGGTLAVLAVITVVVVLDCLGTARANPAEALKKD